MQALKETAANSRFVFDVMLRATLVIPDRRQLAGNTGIRGRSEKFRTRAVAGGRHQFENWESKTDNPDVHSRFLFTADEHVYSEELASTHVAARRF